MIMDLNEEMVKERILNTYQKFKSWLDNRSFHAHKLRGALIGSIITITSWEITCYRMMQSMAKSGTLSAYGPDTTIVVFGILETVLSPFLSWFGYARRRSMIIATLALTLTCLFFWTLLPNVNEPEEPEFCHGRSNSVYGGIQAFGKQLTLILCNCLLILAAKVVVLCHGIAYIEEHGPERLSIHLGVLIFVRVTALAVGHHLIGLVVTKQNIIIFVANIVACIIQFLLFMPSSTLKEPDAPNIPSEGRRFFKSVRRVLSNPLAFTQILSLALLAAAVWGYSYNAADIIKVKFFIFKKSDIQSFFAELLAMFIILMSALYIGLRWSPPILPQFCKQKAIRHSSLMTMLVVVLLVILTVALKCEHGSVAGMDGGLYTNPSCSSECGCSARWREVSPVCVVNDMTTYLSPCQAGCGGVEDKGGLMVYKNCTCSTSGLATAGACGERDCEAARSLQQVLYLALLIFTVLAFQAHLTLLLKVADPRDKGVTLGLTGSAIALFAFVLGHFVFCKIHWATCIWKEAGRCQMNSQQLPNLIGGVSALLAFTSAMICIGTLICIKVQKRRQETIL